MAKKPTNVQSISQERLGNLVKIYPLRHRTWQRWGNLLSGLVLLAVGAVTLVWGGVVLYQRYYEHGPAILWKTTLPFAVIGGVALALAFVLLVTAGLRWSREVVLYEHGVVIRQRKGNKICWDQVEEIRIGRTQSLFLGLPTGAKQWITLSDRDGKRVSIRNDYASMDELIGALRETITSRLYPQSAADYLAGGSLDFGPLVINREKGISRGVDRLSWAEIKHVEIKGGKLIIQPDTTGGQRKYLRIPTSEITNLDILARLMAQQVDVRFD